MMNKKILINFSLFQLSWFACVIGAAKDLPWLGVIITFIFVIWHLSRAKIAHQELLLLVCALVLGGLFDQTMQSLNLISYQAHLWSEALIPAWILALWLAFSCTLNVSLRWMRGKHLIAIIFGLIGGPLAYIGAAKLGAASIIQTPQSLIAISIGWAIITPLLIRISQKFDGYTP
jgi:hypothetical protein